MIDENARETEEFISELLGRSVLRQSHSSKIEDCVDVCLEFGDGVADGSASFGEGIAREIAQRMRHDWEPKLKSEVVARESSIGKVLVLRVSVDDLKEFAKTVRERKLTHGRRDANVCAL